MAHLKRIFIMVLVLLIVGVFPGKAMAKDIYGCYKKNNGQLRIVGNHTECLPSELPITLGGPASIQMVKLACVTAAHGYHDQGEPSEDPFVIITNQKNILINDPTEVFDVVWIPVGNNPDSDFEWGLACKDGWIVIGCSAGTVGDADVGMYKTGQPFDTDLKQVMNRCTSDDEEYQAMTLFVTCCKNVQP